MNESHPRFWEIFSEVFDALPRQGPGNRVSTARALSLCRELPHSPSIIDLGCGAGKQTLDLAELTSGSILAIDTHPPAIERLRETAARCGLSHRIKALVADMSNLNQRPASFDLVWSEGALYSIGLHNALRICHTLLRPGGWVAFTDAVWLKQNPPAEIKAGFDFDYPLMGTLQEDLQAVEECGFHVLGHFILPDDACWNDFYTPMQARIAELRNTYSTDRQALELLEQIAREPELHRRYSDFYGYAFIVAQR